MRSCQASDWGGPLQPSDRRFLLRTAQKVALLVQDQREMKQFRRRLTEFGERWTAYRIAYEAGKAGQWQPEMGTPENPLGTIWPGAYVQQQPGCFPAYPKDVPTILGDYAVLGTIHDRVLPQCKRINEACLPDELVEEVWLNLVTGRCEESHAIGAAGPRYTIPQHRLSRSLDCVRADLEGLDQNPGGQGRLSQTEEDVGGLAQAGETTMEGELKEWSPPKDHLNAKEIKDKYSVPGPTLQVWKRRDDVTGGPLAGRVIKAPGSAHTLYYPEDWVKEQVKDWQPRNHKRRGSRS